MNYTSRDHNSKALAYCDLGFNALPLFDPSKSKTKHPAVKWRYGEQDYTVARFGPEDIRKAAKLYQHGIIAITGVNHLRNIDVDQVTDFTVLDELLELLGLPPDYAWVVISGSKKGGQIWLRNDEGDQALIDAGMPRGEAEGIAKTVYDTPALDSSRFNHIELRWRGNCVVLPPSIHPSGNLYTFRSGEMPTTPPAFVPASRIKAALAAVGKPYEIPEAPPTLADDDGEPPVVCAVESEHPYAVAALTRMAKEIAGMKQGARRPKLFAHAAYLFEFCNAGHLNKEHVISTLLAACKKCGLTEAEGEECMLCAEKKVGNKKRDVPPEPEEYEKTDLGMVWNGGRLGPVSLSNFTAEILADTVTDDGAERSRSYEICAQLRGRRVQFEVDAKEYASCNWVPEHLGARARVAVGQSVKSHLANAISACSPDMKDHEYYAHTGWRKISGTMVYLHAGGAVSHVSHVENNNNNLHDSPQTPLYKPFYEPLSHVSHVSHVDIQASVKLTGTLKKYVLSQLRDDAREAIRASLRIITLTRDPVAIALYCAMVRAVLGEIDFGVHLAGQSGHGKTALCALLQQHWGASMNERNLPGSWESTENSLEMLLFQAKDAVCVVDDFKPKGSKNEQDRLHSKADRIFRQIGNGSARGRLNGNLEQRIERAPRCMLISTGEDTPKGQSLKARSLSLVMSENITAPGESSKRLSACQKDARSGKYEQAMSAYIAWLAPRIEAFQQKMPDLIASERDALSIGGHARSSTNTANLLIGMKCFLQFALEAGAISYQEAHATFLRCKNALLSIADDAAQENAHDKPSEQYIRLVRAAITSQGAHLVDPQGDCPGVEYGWITSVRNVDDGMYGKTQEETFRPGGPKIGWIDGEDVYLLPAAAYKAAKAMGAATGDDITTAETTMRKYLNQDNLLASTDVDKKRKLIPIRRRFQGVQEEVLHFKKEILFTDDTLSNLHDSHDSHDSENSEEAPQAAPEIGHGESCSGTESCSSPDSDMTQAEKAKNSALPATNTILAYPATDLYPSETLYPLGAHVLTRDGTGYLTGNERVHDPVGIEVEVRLDNGTTVWVPRRMAIPVKSKTA